MPIRIVTDSPTRISRNTVEAALKRREPGVRLIVRDSSCPGLALVVNPRGESWRFDWRPRGLNPAKGRRWPMQSVSIGTPASHSPDAARAEAGRLRGQAKGGVDPAEQRKAKVAEESRRRAFSTDDALTEYERDLKRRPKLRGTGTLNPDSVNSEIAHVLQAVDLMGVKNRHVGDVVPADVSRLLTLSAKHPATARKRYGALSRFLDWAVDNGHMPENPCTRIPKGQRPRAVRPRPVCPTLTDLAAIWQAAESLTPAERDAVRWLIAIPCRLREATKLEWQHVDLQRRTINLPSEMMKTGEPHSIHIHDFALALISRRHAQAGRPKSGLVFPAVRSGRPIEGTTKIKRRLADVSGARGWTFHDFRRSFASEAAELGVAESVADAVLSHAQSATRAGVLGVYQKAKRWPDQVKAMNAWGAAVQAAVIGLASR